MAWAQVANYITAIAPELTQELIGVPEEHILAFERGLNLQLPPSYRDFLRTMGVDAGSFYPLGGGMEWNFHDLLRDLHDRDYSPHDFFRIATEVDDSFITHNALYLDMQTVDADGDCAVLMIESCLTASREGALRPRESFLEIVVKQIWRLLDAPRFAHDRIILVTPESKDDDAAHKATILQVLQHAGFHHTLARAGRVDCLSLDGNQSGTVRVEYDEYGLTTFIACENESAASRLTQLLLDNVDGARVSEQFSSLRRLQSVE